MSVLVWGFGGTVLSLSYDRKERDGAREGGTEGERDTQRQREGGTEGEGEGGRELLTAEENCFFFFRPARERGWRKGGRGRERGTKGPGGERAWEGRTDGPGGGGRETKTKREGGREILMTEEKKILLPPRKRERVAEGRAGGGEREREREGGCDKQRERAREGGREGGERESEGGREGERERGRE